MVGKKIIIVLHSNKCLSMTNQAWDQTCGPWFTRQVVYPLHHVSFGCILACRDPENSSRGPDNVLFPSFSHVNNLFYGPPSRGPIPEFLRKPIATCDFPVGDGVQTPCSPTFGSTHVLHSCVCLCQCSGVICAQYHGLVCDLWHFLAITVLPAKSDSDIMFCLHSYQGLRTDRSFVY